MRYAMFLVMLIMVSSCEPPGDQFVLTKMKSPVIVISIGDTDNGDRCAFVRDANGEIAHISDNALESLSVGDTLK